MDLMKEKLLVKINHTSSPEGCTISQKISCCIISKLASDITLNTTVILLQIKPASTEDIGWFVF